MNGPVSVASVRLDMRHITCGISFLATEENPNWIGSIGVRSNLQWYLCEKAGVPTTVYIIYIRRNEREF